MEYVSTSNGKEAKVPSKSINSIKMLMQEVSMPKSRPITENDVGISIAKQLSGQFVIRLMK